MKTVFWGNYKGGVGKTTSVFQIAGKFAEAGKKVLLIDLDPQCSLSNICCNSEKLLENYNVEKTFNYLIELYRNYIISKKDIQLSLLLDEKLNKISIITNSMCVNIDKPIFNNNLYFIPSSISFENSRINELSQKMSENSNNIFLIKLFLDDIKNNVLNFDYIFFDCPPTTNILLQSVFLASDYYIVPTIIDEISTKGVPDYITEIEKTYTKYCMDSKIGGIIMNKVFKEKAKFIGVFETIYKERRGYSDNSNQIESLDKNIKQLARVKSIVSEDKFQNHRYNKTVDAFDTENIFKYYIGNKDNRSGGESIPANTSQGELTPSYGKLAAALQQII